MAQSDFERKAEQIRSQLENLRDSIDDLQSSGASLLEQAGIPVSKITRQAKHTARQASRGIKNAGFAWWVPLAVIGVIGVGIWLFNQFVPRTQDQFTNFPTGQ